MTAHQTTEDGWTFDQQVPLGGYRWWYIDALSDDGLHALTLIAFIGSVFSPYYARARNKNGLGANPRDHCAMNMALYGPGTHHWSMTERGQTALSQSADRIGIGPSCLLWDGVGLTATIDEVTVPYPSRLRGELRVTPARMRSEAYSLDGNGRHFWRPIAPSARIEVAFSRPHLRWQGNAYIDTNTGARALEQDFTDWHWSRADLGGGRSAVFYDVSAREKSESNSLCLCFEANGRVRHLKPRPFVTLQPSSWGIQRRIRSDDGNHTEVVKTLESGPFYARSLVQSRTLGEPVVAVHESLSLDRFQKQWVRALLPFRMPRHTK